MVTGWDGDADRSFSLLPRLLEVPTSNDPERFLEIIILEALPVTAVTLAPIKQTEPTITPTAALPTKPEPPKPAKSAKKAPISGVLDEAVWPNVLQALKQKHNTLYSVVRMAQPDFSEAGTLRLIFAFGFHQKRLKENGNQQVLIDTIEELTGQPVRIDCLLDKDAKPPKTAPAAAAPPASQELSAISNIFGGAELLES
jgi:hypothetical protein